MLAADILLYVYVVVLLLLASNGAHRLWLLWTLRHPAPAAPPMVSMVDVGQQPDQLPWVTVQLPLFNEPRVAADAIASLAALEWPKSRLLLQILDDSTDETQHITRALADRLKAEGFVVQWRHREDRTGYKAGALAAALPDAAGELVAIFDADFRPHPDFLRRLVPHFEDPGVGVVQARWGHLNRTDSRLTAAQAVLLDGHFNVEHAGRYRAGHWFNFNGTAGIWRLAAIEAGGGWSGSTLTEDLDLSYRAQLAGWRFILRDDVVAPAELPPNFGAFRSQQHRWAKGSIQTAKALLGPIWRSDAPLSQRTEASAHLLANASHPLVVLLAVVLPLMGTARSVATVHIPFALDLVVLGFAVVPFALYYGVGAWRANPAAPLAGWASIPAALALGIGLSVSQAGAVLSGLFGPVGAFVRTAKGGLKQEAGGVPVGWRLWTESALAVWLALGVAGNAWAGEAGSVPFLMLFLMGYGWVSAMGWSERAARASHTSQAAMGSQVSGQSQRGSAQAPPPTKEVSAP